MLFLGKTATEPIWYFWFIRNLFAQNTFTSKYKLAIGSSECNNIRKKLNKIYTGKVTSNTANSWKFKGSYNMYI